MQLHYNLAGEPIPLTEWARLLVGPFSQRCVAQHWVQGWKVSTVWVGLDMAAGESRTPLIFETMVFAPSQEEARHHPEWDGAQARYPSEAIAEDGHWGMLRGLLHALGASAEEIAGAGPEPVIPLQDLPAFFPRDDDDAAGYDADYGDAMRVRAADYGKKDKVIL
jgi:hypothetical protein